MVDVHQQPGIRDMTGTALCRIMADRADMAGAAVAHGMAEYGLIPGFQAMTGITLTHKFSSPMIYRLLMT